MLIHLLHVFILETWIDIEQGAPMTLDESEAFFMEALFALIHPTDRT
jgi:hypothetical protein